MTLKKTLLIVAAAGLAFSACQNQHADLTTKTNVGAPFKYDSLSYEQAKKYVSNYEKRAGYVDSIYKDQTGRVAIVKKPNSRSIWFSAQRLQTLLDKIKSEGGDGIRFYYAAYDSVYSKTIGGNAPPQTYWGYNTVVMVSTKDSTNLAKEIFHRDYFTSKPQASKPTLGFILGGTPENRGELCPPPKDCNAVGALLIP